MDGRRVYFESVHKFIFVIQRDDKRVEYTKRPIKLYGYHVMCNFVLNIKYRDLFNRLVYEDVQCVSLKMKRLIHL